MYPDLSDDQCKIASVNGLDAHVLQYGLALGSIGIACREEWFDSGLQVCSELANITEPELPVNNTSCREDSIVGASIHVHHC